MNPAANLVTKLKQLRTIDGRHGNRQRLGFALFAVLFVVFFSWFFNHHKPDSTSNPPTLQSTSEPAKEKTAVPQATPDNDMTQARPVDIFAPRNWRPAPPKIASRPQPILPAQAPPLPFKFLGKIIDSDSADTRQTTAFLLTYGDKVLTVRLGNWIDATYRVDRYENGQLYFFYQPMQIQQSLFIGDPA